MTPVSAAVAGARFHKRCLGSLGVDALNPELHVAVLARDPADPRIEAPASEQPRWDIGCLRGGYDLADNTQLSFSALVHGLIPPCRLGFGISCGAGQTSPVFCPVGTKARAGQ